METLTIFQKRQSGKSMIVIGAAKQYIEEFGPKAAVVIYRTQHMARDAAKRWKLPWGNVAWARMDGDVLLHKIFDARLIVIEDNDTWSPEEHSFVGCLMTLRRDREAKGLEAATLITTASHPF